MNCVDIINYCIYVSILFCIGQFQCSSLSAAFPIPFAFVMQVIVAQEDFSSAAHIADLDSNNKFANPKVSDHYRKPLFQMFNFKA